jgi:hypothetical protein
MSFGQVPVACNAIAKGGSNSLPKPPVIIYLFIYLLSMTCSQIWLIPLVDDCQVWLHHKIGNDPHSRRALASVLEHIAR